MWELLHREPGLLFLILIALCGTLIAVTAIIAHYWHIVRQSEADASLKQDMLNRGLSIDQIERLLKASSQSVEIPERPDTISDKEYTLIEKLLDEGKSAEDIERILRACRGPAASAERTSKDVEKALAQKANAPLREGRGIGA